MLQIFYGFKVNVRVEPGQRFWAVFSTEGGMKGLEEFIRKEV